MTKLLEFPCGNCPSVKKIPQTKLATYYGKKIQVNCKRCKKPITIKVNAALFNKKANTTNTFHTKILDKKKAALTPLAKLEVLANQWTNAQNILLEIGENILGRESETSSQDNKRGVQTSDKKVSRIHCKISVEEENGSHRYLLKDENSTNGTFLNDSEAPLEKGDEIYMQIGDTITIGLTKLILKV